MALAQLLGVGLELLDQRLDLGVVRVSGQRIAQASSDDCRLQADLARATLAHRNHIVARWRAPLVGPPTQQLLQAATLATHQALTVLRPFGSFIHFWALSAGKPDAKFWVVREGSLPRIQGVPRAMPSVIHGTLGRGALPVPREVPGTTTSPWMSLVPGA